MKYIKTFNESIKTDLMSLQKTFVEDREKIVDQYTKLLDDSLLYLSDNYTVTVMGPRKPDEYFNSCSVKF